MHGRLTPGLLRPLFVALGAAGALSSAGCDDAGFEQAEEISKLRVLAIRVEPPELGPGALGRIDALVVTPDARPVRYVWEVCAFDTGPDGAFACATDEQGEVLGAEISDQPTAVLPYDVVAATIGTAEELCAALQEIELPDFVELPTCERGFPLTLRLTASVGEGEGEDTETAVKRVLVLREDAVPNRNPGFETVLVGGATIDEAQPLTVPVTAEPLPLQVVVERSEAETYVDGEGREASEQLSLSWYTTHGAIERGDTYYYEGIVPIGELQTNELRLDRRTRPEDGERVTLWFVLRDNRGGVHFGARHLVASVAPEE